MVKKYNDTPHAGLKGNSTPSQVHEFTNLRDIRKQFNLMYRPAEYKSPNKKKRSHCLRVGDTVRITLDSRTRQAFYKAYHARFDEEYFAIAEVLDSGRVPVYVLKDLNGETLEGIFYSQELILVTIPRDVFPCKIIRTRGKGKFKRYLVSWKGYPPSFNSWVDKTALQ